MSDPLVSIIVPIYNAAPNLAACIQSIRNQRYKEIEILLVNDGSEDVSLPICNMYARTDSRITVVNRPNSGVSATRNIALNMAKGEFVQFVDSDDYLDKNATRLMVERMQETESDMVISHYCRVDGSKITVHGFLPEGNALTQLELAQHLMEEPASFYYGVMWNKLYRRNIIEEHGIRCNEELTWSEDFLFNLEYIRYAQRFCSLQTPIYYYCKNDSSITATKINFISAIKVKANL
ncbi:MAG: glycosyltransferase family 2 protein, partial [Oscillospiraceae bacterium]